MINLLLKKTGITWTLYAPKGHILMEFHRCASQEGAYQEARAWASSWIGMCIRLEDEQY